MPSHHGSEMTIILLPNPAVVLFSFTQPFTHDHSFCLPNPFLFGDTIYHNNNVFSVNMEKIHADIVLLASILCFRHLETIPIQTFHFIRTIDT
jgi:hypothetical protein